MTTTAEDDTPARGSRIPVWFGLGSRRGSCCVAALVRTRRPGRPGPGGWVSSGHTAVTKCWASAKKAKTRVSFPPNSCLLTLPTVSQPPVSSPPPRRTSLIPSHRTDSSFIPRRHTHTATDTLMVAWLAGTFGHGAQASPASSLNHTNCLKHVYTKVGPSGVPPPRARALARECYAYHIRLFLGRLWDHSKDSCMSLFHPFAHSHLN